MLGESVVCNVCGKAIELIAGHEEYVVSWDEQNMTLRAHVACFDGEVVAYVSKRRE